ncbi:hypothetical protein BDZ91DRAFT_686376, partial [Kalaharituber pfeilii]
MNSIPNTQNIPASYMNGSAIAAGSNAALQASVAMSNGIMPAGMMVGQMPQPTPQQQAAMFHYQQQQQLQGQQQQMSPYGKMPAQMMNAGNIMMPPPQEVALVSPTHASAMSSAMPANAMPMASPASISSPNTVSAQQQQLLMNRAIESQNQLAIDKARVTLLLEINAELLRETVQLQAAGKHQEDKSADKGFYGCMKRLQANLAYLAAVADGSRKPAVPIPPCPAILHPPSDMPSLIPSYKKLQELFPGAKPSNPPLPHQTPQQQQHHLQQLQLQGQLQQGQQMG